MKITKDGFICVKLTEEEERKIKNFAYEIVKKKETENHHKIDHGSEIKRFYNGFAGELALEKVLKENILDFTIGDSHKYNVADLHKIGLNVGVKTVEAGKAHIVHKDPNKPEILIKIDNNNPRRLIIMGLAEVDVMKKYCDDNLILSPALRARNVKTGFAGYHKLKKFKNLEELKQLLKAA